MQITVRDADEADMEALSVLMNDLNYPTTVAEMQVRFKAIVTHPDYKTIVAVLNHDIVGMAGLQKGRFYEKNGMYLRILAFVVKQGVRNKGVGKILINAAEGWAIKQGLTMAFVNSGNNDNRKDAHAFYLKAGYIIKSSGFVKQLL